MQIYTLLVCCFVLLACAAAESAENSHKHKHGHKHGHKHKHGHHKHHHGHHHHHGKHDSVPADTTQPAPAAKAEAKVVAAPVKLTVAATESKATHVATKAVQGSDLVAKMKLLESRLAEKKKKQRGTGQILVLGPLPADFKDRFSQAVAKATGVDTKSIKVTSTPASKDDKGVFSVNFEADKRVVKEIEGQATDPASKLTQGSMRPFLVEDDDAAAPVQMMAGGAEPAKKGKKGAKKAAGGDVEATPVQEKGIDIDTAMPYGDLEPFGREDTAQELTEDSISESNSMVDQLERAEVAEEKRAVFRALTRLRGAAITSFDGVARSQTGNIDEYNKIHKWRETHPLHHLADEESDISKWAFPDNADF